MDSIKLIFIFMMMLLFVGPILISDIITQQWLWNTAITATNVNIYTLGSRLLCQFTSLFHISFPRLGYKQRNCMQVIKHLFNESSVLGPALGISLYLREISYVLRGFLVEISLFCLISKLLLLMTSVHLVEGVPTLRFQVAALNNITAYVFSNYT